MANLELHCLSHPLHFTDPHRWEPSWNAPLEGTGTLGDGWSVRTRGPWTVAIPHGTQLPGQGWKIHVSATAGNAQEILTRCVGHLAAHGIPFKHLRNLAMVVAGNLRGMSRSSAGKVITVYPADADAFVRCADALAGLLTGLDAPAVLSDRRWAPQAPVYFRYGAFTAQQLWTEDGRRVLARSGPGGTPVEDTRAIPFRVPADVEVPAPIADRLAAQPRTDSLPPLTFTAALRHSTGGGLYRATMPDGSPAVVKEARPLTGGRPDLADSVHRLHTERDALRRLTGRGVVPEVLADFELGGHHFLALSEAPGDNLQHWVAAHHPQLSPEPQPGTVQQYLTAVDRIITDLRVKVAGLHAAGLGHNDLHPGNVMVDAELTTTLVDLESATAVDVVPPRGMDCPGFVPATGTARQRDDYALTVIHAWMLNPGLGAVTEMVPDVAARYAEVAEGWFGRAAAAPLREAARLVQQDGRRTAAHRVGVTLGPVEALDAGRLTGYLHRFCRPDVEDAVPGDPQGLDGPVDRLSLAHGLGGIVAALHSTGAEVPAGWREWAAGTLRSCPATPGSPGLWDGWAGVALSWHLLRDDELTALALGHAEQAAAGCTDPSLASGLAGYGLAVLTLGAALDRPDLQGQAVQIADDLHRDVGLWAGRCQGTGLITGPSGIAVFLTRAATALGEPAWLDSARAYLAADLELCRPGPTGALMVDQGDLVKGYLGEGSLGVALARRTVHAALGLPWDATDLQLCRAAFVDVMVEPGLLRGHAGLSHALHRLAEDCPQPQDAARLRHWARRHREHVALHAVAVDGTHTITGRGGCRLSADLATGAAGVLALLHQQDAHPQAAQAQEALPGNGFRLLDLLLGGPAPTPPARAGRRTRDALTTVDEPERR